MIELMINESSKNNSAQTLNNPTDVKIHKGTMYVVDSGNARVVKMNDRMEWETICGGKSKGNNDNQLDNPT